MGFISGELERIVCDAINIIVDKKIGDAHYDRLISGTVISNNLNGQNAYNTSYSDGTYSGTYQEDCYRVKYQNSEFIAYPLNTNDTYEKDDTVLILIPNNDMRNEKYIMRRRPQQVKYIKNNG